MSPLLPHHADLLRHRQAAPRPRVHHDHRRRPRPLAPPARRRRPLPHRHRRARPEGGRHAEAAGKTPQEFVDEIAPLYAEAWERLDITNDDFIRTTEQRHKIGVAELLQRCYDAGDIELDVYKGKYCVACEEYYTDDELDPGDLCRIHKRPVEYYEEENYFFRLSRFQQRLLDWYDAHPGAIKPEFRGNEALGLIRGGLRDFSVSRTSLKWGIPLPWDSKHVAYVWFDALANYITAIGYGTDEERFSTWWPGRHLIGKDIIRHHCVYWPAMLMSAGIEPPAGWAVGGWLLVGGEKMSKTSGNVVNPLDLVDEIGVDGFRYYVLAETPYGQDGDFTYEGLDRPLQQRPRQQPRQPAVARRHRGRQEVRRRRARRPSPTRRSPPSPRPRTPTRPRRGTTCSRAARSRRRGASSAPRTPTSRRTSRGRPSPARRVDAVMGDALEALRIVAVLASPAVPDSAPGRVGAHRPARPGHRPAPPRGRRRGAATPAGSP